MVDFLEKWSRNKAQRPKAGTKNAVHTFLNRVAEQKSFLTEYEEDTGAFKRWRSTWFQKVPGGFGVTVGRDSVNAGNGLSYVVVETTAAVREFLDDLAHHAQNDIGFQQALEDNRTRRAGLLSAAKARTTSPRTTPAKRTSPVSSRKPKAKQ